MIGAPPQGEDERDSRLPTTASSSSSLNRGGAGGYISDAEMARAGGGGLESLGELWGGNGRVRRVSWSSFFDRSLRS